ncbi:hypothetical protein [Xenorhabdus koppenhoeferi]|uniref:Uncharacterized protein n=1 Tax=Xenorhabdus koppenhoeferi TaxID=351659 RepID=A0A1I7K8M5_9GAMM|nr:hypothetical protein [Xenorhabdus koppenhoeferi]SFU93803.1 hypothetical protein SAMN05421784_14929 [Xenorhabdus koppenhoeferi]
MLSDKKQELVSIASRHLNTIGIIHSIDTCGTIAIQTKQGKVIYYPTKEKIQYKGTVTTGGIDNVKNLVESLELSKETMPQTNEMTLRDYFAAQAMQGDWASQGTDFSCFGINTIDETLNNVASLYYRMADAMMNARKNDTK